MGVVRQQQDGERVQEDTASHEAGLLQTSAQIVYTIPAQRGVLDSVFGASRPSLPCRLTGSIPHKSGGRRVQSWPDDTHKQTHSSHLDL